MTRDTFAAKFSNHEAAAEYADLNGWKLETTEPMERGVWAQFSTPRDFLGEIVTEHDTLTTAATAEKSPETLPRWTTAYSFHRAEDHEILAVANPANVQEIAQLVAFSLTGAADQTRRAYIHNGRGIVGAGLCRKQAWHDTLREDYMHLDPHARLKRTEYGLSNDPL